MIYIFFQTSRKQKQILQTAAAAAGDVVVADVEIPRVTQEITASA